VPDDAQAVTRRERKRLTAFLYLLMRDHLPAGKAEELVRTVSEPPDEPVFLEFGSLAAYARKMAERLLGDED